MCGINGIYGLKDSKDAASRILRMNTCMSHRGPDDEGQFISDGIALGHRRLSIIDLSAAGHQPMFSADKRYCIVYNGELYNFRELKMELQRVRAGSDEQSYFFSTGTDTEVILAAFARWGADCVKRFNGMFAFAIWDDLKKELFIARDRLGIKPLYYFFTGGVFGFSSEIRSLLASGLIEKSIDERSLAEYIRYQTVHAPSTIVRGVKMLLPGHCVEIKEGSPKIRRYWDLVSSVKTDAKKKSYAEVCTDVKDLLRQAVERRLVADVPFGAFLSGGIDSSAIVGLMSSVSASPVKTFCISFGDDELSEAQYARLVAKKFNTDHHEITLTPQDFLAELPAALKAMDHPSGDGPNTYIVSKATRNAGITMALSGLGGDELFAGYDVFKRAASIGKKKWLNAVPRPMRKMAGSMIKTIKPGVAGVKVAELLGQPAVDLRSFYSLSRKVLPETIAAKLLIHDKYDDPVSKILDGLGLEKLPDLLSAVSVAEISTYMQNVLLRDTDQMSMAHALEVRVPFIDHTLVEYVLGIPDEYKFPHTPKKLLVDALGDLLPPEIVNRPKMGFTFPWKKWMKHELKDFCEKKMSSLAKRKYFDERAVLDLWKRFLADDQRITWSRIWHLVVLEEWLSENGFSS